MVDYIFIVLISLSTIITVWKLSLSGAVFIVPLAIHAMVRNHIPDDILYYASSGVLSVLSFIVLTRIETKTSESLAWLAAFCIFSDILGLILWRQDQPAMTYNILFIVVYLLSIVIIGKEDGSRNLTFFRGHSRAGLPIHLFSQHPSGTKKEKTL